MHLECDERDENRIIIGEMIRRTLKSICNFWIKHSSGEAKPFGQTQRVFRLKKIPAAVRARVSAGLGLVLVNEGAATFCSLLSESIICIIKSSVSGNWSLLFIQVAAVSALHAAVLNFPTQAAAACPESHQALYSSRNEDSPRLLTWSMCWKHRCFGKHQKAPVAVKMTHL